MENDVCTVYAEGAIMTHPRHQAINNALEAYLLGPLIGLINSYVRSDQLILVRNGRNLGVDYTVLDPETKVVSKGSFMIEWSAELLAAWSTAILTRKDCRGYDWEADQKRDQVSGPFGGCWSVGFSDIGLCVLSLPVDHPPRLDSPVPMAYVVSPEDMLVVSRSPFRLPTATAYPVTRVTEDFLGDDRSFRYQDWSYYQYGETCRVLLATRHRDTVSIHCIGNRDGIAFSFVVYNRHILLGFTVVEHDEVQILSARLDDDGTPSASVTNAFSGLSLSLPRKCSYHIADTRLYAHFHTHLNNTIFRYDDNGWSMIHQYPFPDILTSRVV